MINLNKERKAIKIKKYGFISLECVISLFILSLIVFLITSSLHNSSNLLNKNKDSLKMLSIAKEVIEDERIKIKNSENGDTYTKTERIDKYVVITSVGNTSYYKCYNLDVKISYDNNSMELNTYVTKK